MGLGPALAVGAPLAASPLAAQDVAVVSGLSQNRVSITADFDCS